MSSMPGVHARLDGLALGVRLRPVMYACFLISGAVGLIYQVVWARQLGLFLGITTYAHTAVVTACMLGLAVGSLVSSGLAHCCPGSLPFPNFLFRNCCPTRALWVGIVPCQKRPGDSAASTAVEGNRDGRRRTVPVRHLRRGSFVCSIQAMMCQPGGELCPE